MTHHTHLVQTRLAIKQYEAVSSCVSIGTICNRVERWHSLSVLEMSLHYPSVLQKCIRALIVPQIDTLASIPYDISRTGIHSGSIPHKFLQIRNVIRSHCARSSVTRFLSGSKMKVLRTRTPLWKCQVHRDTPRNAHFV